MRKYQVDIETYASAVVIVEISDEDLEKFAESLEMTVDELDQDDLTDLIYEKMDPPNICAQCSGWGQSWGLDLGDEWNISDDRTHGEHPENPEHRSIRLIK